MAFYNDKGIHYQYSRTILEALPWTSILEEIKSCIQTNFDLVFNSCLCNYYHNGQDSMDWHQDNEIELGKNPLIVSVSFGEVRLFQLKHIEDKTVKKNIRLGKGRILIMWGEMQHY